MVEAAARPDGGIDTPRLAGERGALRHAIPPFVPARVVGSPELRGEELGGVRLEGLRMAIDTQSDSRHEDA